jgi:hypothetical protein
MIADGSIQNYQAPQAYKIISDFILQHIGKAK